MKRTFIVFAVMFTMLAGCGGGGDGGGGGGGGSGPATWTILLYLHGDHNLEPSVLADLEEMEQVGSSAGFNLAFQLDVRSVSGVDRGLVANHPAPGFGTVAIQSLPEQDSDDPNVLRDFLIWGIQNYPADRYGVVLWDHGGQWKNTFGGNQTTGPGSGMNCLEVRQALTGALSTVGRSKFDFLGFDTCLNGGAELALQYGDLCDLYIGCPELDYGAGWNYGSMLGWLKTNPDATVTQLGAQEVATWEAQHSVPGTMDALYRCHAAYNMAQLGNFRTALDSFAIELNSSLGSEGVVQDQARVNATPYFRDSDTSFPREYVDLGHFTALMATGSAIPSVQAAANNLLTVLTSFVIARSVGSQISASARAISIYLPIDAESPPSATDISTFGTLAISTQTSWDTYLNSWLARIALDTAGPVVTVTGTVNTTNPTVASPSVINFTVTGTDTTALLGLYGKFVSGTLFDLYGHLFYQRAGQGSYVASWNGNGVGLTDGTNTDFFCGFLVEPGSNIVCESAIYDPPGAAPPIQVQVYGDTSTLTVVLVVDVSGSAPRPIIVQPSGTIGAQYIRLDAATGTATLAPTGFTVTVPAGGMAGLSLFSGTLATGSYRILVGAEDYAGNSEFQGVTITKP